MRKSILIILTIFIIQNIHAGSPMMVGLNPNKVRKGNLKPLDAIYVMPAKAVPYYAGAKIVYEFAKSRKEKKRFNPIKHIVPDIMFSIK